MGCWGVVSAGGGGGGTRTLPDTKRTLTDSTGQWSAGESASASYKIRAGYIQPFDTSTAAAIDSDPVTVGQGADIYLPVLHNYFKIVYVCPY